MEILKARIAKILDRRTGNLDQTIPVSTLLQMERNLLPIVSELGRKNLIQEAYRVSVRVDSDLSVADITTHSEQRIAYLYPILHRNPIETASDLTHHVRAFLGESEDHPIKVFLGYEMVNGKVQIDLEEMYKKLSMEDFISLVSEVKGLEAYLSQKYNNYTERHYYARINRAWALKYRTIEYDHPFPLIYSKKSGGYVSIAPIITEEDMPFIEQLKGYR